MGSAKPQSAFPCRPAGSHGKGRMMESQMRSDLMGTNDETITPSKLRDTDPALNLQFHDRLGSSIKR
jgi:hypothetical protein